MLPCRQAADHRAGRTRVPMAAKKPTLTRRMARRERLDSLLLHLFKHEFHVSSMV